jgi:hypothetical protein
MIINSINYLTVCAYFCQVPGTIMFHSIRNLFLFSEIGNAILEYQKFGKSIRMKHEHVPAGTMRSIKEIINDETCVSASTVAAVSKQLADYLRLLHESFIAIDQICETNIYIEVNKTKVRSKIIRYDILTE